MKPSPDNRPIVTPVKTDKTPDLGPVAVMAATQPDYKRLQAQFGFKNENIRPLFTTNLAVGTDITAGLSLCGPFIGAPYGAMILETLIAWGARRIIFLGWCGAVAEHVQIGHIILPGGALVDEGTSRHYRQPVFEPVAPSKDLLKITRNVLTSANTAFHEGLIWTTDAPFREMPQTVTAFKARGVLAVEMELSALLSVGKFHGIEVAGLLVVSDELSSLTWKPGFKSEAFKKGRQTAAETVKQLIKVLI